MAFLAHLLSPRFHVQPRFLTLAGVTFLTACSGMPGPSVPHQSGKNFAEARYAVQTCAPDGPKGGKNAVVGSYVAGVLLGGLVVGPIIVASTESSIRASGEVNAVDRCLTDLGYARRELTDEEIQALKAAYGERRRLMLDHLVAGGSVETFEGALG